MSYYCPERTVNRRGHRRGRELAEAEIHRPSYRTDLIIRRCGTTSSLKCIPSQLPQGTLGCFLFIMKHCKAFLQEWIEKSGSLNVNRIKRTIFLNRFPKQCVHSFRTGPDFIVIYFHYVQQMLGTHERPVKGDEDYD